MADPPLTSSVPDRYWALEAAEVLEAAGSSAAGLPAGEASSRLAAYGPNRLAPHERTRGLRLLLAQFTSPIVLILIGATVLSAVLGDLKDSLIILAIILAGGVLGFWQEHTAGEAVDALTAQIRATARLLRDGSEVEVPSEEVVVGDVLLLTPGTVIAADARVLATEGLLLDEAALTGESYPAAKAPAPVAAGAAPGARASAVFMGTHVLSGTGTAVVTRTGLATEFGALSRHVAAPEVTTGFERGATRFGLMLMRTILVLVAAVFAVNVALHRPAIDALLFSLALAVGITPQMLPAIVSVSLSTGAKRMAAEKVIVRRLDAIEDFGAMSVLCTDKTGTITEGTISLDQALDLAGSPSDEVRRLGWLNATLQHGFPNPLDLAISREHPDGMSPGAVYLGEVPYDFSRKRLSVLVDEAGTRTLITKGALRRLLEVCSGAVLGGRIVPIDDARQAIEQLFEELSGAGLRVLGVATRPMPAASAVTVSDERDLTLRGVLAFADPPKETARASLEELRRLGVSVVLLTGDSVPAARHTAGAVGLAAARIVAGQEIDRLDDASLQGLLREVTVFAELEPLHKERILRSYRALGETVGFLGDGINDAAALHAADIGISVDSAVDIAKQTASIVLLDKSLRVVADGIALGRRTFANTLKYVRVTISANFGNVVSMAIASAFLPFLPLLPTQILLLNFLSDVPALAIAGDAVDPEQTATPERWEVGAITRFMIAFGLLSSVFDILTFLVMHLGFHADATLFRSGWFVESTATELAALLILRTGRVFWRSRPSTALAMLSAAVLAVTIVIPYSPLAQALGLGAVPWAMVGVLAGLIVVYALGNELLKGAYGRRRLTRADDPTAGAA